MKNSDLKEIKDEISKVKHPRISKILEHHLESIIYKKTRILAETQKRLYNIFPDGFKGIYYALRRGAS